MYRILAGPTLLAVACLLLAGCHRREAAQMSNSARDARIQVTPIKPLRKTLVRYCELPGQTAPLEEAPLLAKVTGYVRKIHVDIGDRVTGPVYVDGARQQLGQVLVELEVPELEQEVRQKQAAVEQTQAEVVQAEAAVKVAEATRDTARAGIDEVRATIARVQADVDRCTSELERVTQLASRQAVTEKLVDETRNQLRAAEAAREETAAKTRSASARLAEAETLVAKAAADVNVAHAHCAVAQADRDHAETMLAFSQIRAPFDGVVAARSVDVGHLVKPASTPEDALMIIANTQIIRVFVDVPEVDAVYIEPQAEAAVRLPALGTDEFTGSVTRTTWVLNRSTRTLRTQIDLANDGGRLRPGMYAYARLKVAERPNAIVLPKTAVMSSTGLASCWLIDAAGTLRRQVLQTGIESGTEIEITSGLDGQEDLIGVNAAAFREGQQVEPLARRK